MGRKLWWITGVQSSVTVDGEGAGEGVGANVGEI
jgi:hypothetical protein